MLCSEQCNNRDTATLRISFICCSANKYFGVLNIIGCEQSSFSREVARSPQLDHLNDLVVAIIVVNLQRCRRSRSWTAERPGTGRTRSRRRGGDKAARAANREPFGGGAAVAAQALHPLHEAAVLLVVAAVVRRAARGIAAEVSRGIGQVRQGRAPERGLRRVRRAGGGGGAPRRGRRAQGPRVGKVRDGGASGGGTPAPGAIEAQRYDGSVVRS
mmetsp:Transcript_50535/g.93418  ORF Transcript_50535/g.93418 Transcript_50535/m.93418 type:complete len:215 (-) Transcript_50535:380-1024(-)